MGSWYGFDGKRADHPTPQPDFPTQRDVDLIDQAIAAATLDDGFGNVWQTCGPDCDLQIVRPGKVQCDQQDGNCPEARRG